MFRSMHRRFWVLVLALTATACLAAPAALALDNGWPRTLPVDEGMVTIYAPQVDGLDGDVLRYRAALAWRPSMDAEPIFGAGWFESKVNIDREQRIVHPLDLRLTNTRFPAGTADVQAALTTALAQQAPSWNLDFSLDQLDADLNAAQAEAQARQQLNTKPPQIIYRDHPALLVTLDGEPVLRAIENSPYQAVINTPYPLISDGKRYYLNAAKGVWYRANAATGPYAFDPRVPADITAMVKPDEAGEGEEAGKAGQAPLEPVTAANAPEIVISTVPAELIVTEGPADFVPLVDDLLVLQNSADDVFMHVSSQQYYIVLAGRWYRARSLGGPWAYQAADELPPAFANIPQSSEQADSRVYVAGTPEADEAVLDAQVPQTAAVALGPADVDVAYDGEPEFEPVAGTDLEYATNTGAAVLQSDRQYYLVEDGVWYVSDTPNGPWQVSAYRPATVNAIPPTSPVYNVKYVYIYDRTPDVVYVGYTPGYLGSYVYYNTVVYGTGWYYRPWVTPYYYYPRPSTWGYHVSYDPWYGWGYGLSWNWGWPYYGSYYGLYYGSYYGSHFGPYYANYYAGGYWHHHHYWHHRHYGYWGPRGYYPHHGHHGYRDGRYAYRRDRYGDDRYGDGDGRHGRGDDRYGDDRAWGGRHDNLYRDGRQRARVVDTRDNPRGDPSARQFYAAREKNGFNRTQPVKPSEMRMKAQLRDVNLLASRKTLLADNGGKVYQKAPTGGTKPATKAQREAKAVRGTEPMSAARALQQRSGGATNGAQKQAEQKRVAQNRTMPASAKVAPSDKGMTAAQAVKRMDRGAPKAETRAVGQLGKAAAPRQASAPVQRKAAPVQQGAAPVQHKAAPARQSQFAPADSRTVPKASTATRPAGSKNLGQAVRQKSYATFSTPAQQAPARAAVGQAAPRMDQAAPRTERSAPPARYSAPAQQPQAYSEPHYAPPVQQPPRGNERSAGGPRGESARNGSRRGDRD